MEVLKEGAGCDSRHEQLALLQHEAHALKDKELGPSLGPLHTQGLTVPLKSQRQHKGLHG